MGSKWWKVGELAKQTGLSVRTLHYYDEIGLMKPSHHTESGYRLYATEDIVRLQQIKSLRQLGFSLEEIRDCLDSPDFTPRRVIQLHLERLREQIALQQRLCDCAERTALRAIAWEQLPPVWMRRRISASKSSLKSLRLSLCLKNTTPQNN